MYPPLMRIVIAGGSGLLGRALTDGLLAEGHRIQILSRQPADLVPLLPPRALVFIGGHGGRWWPSAAQRTAHAFTRHGCRVVFVHV